MMSGRSFLNSKRSKINTLLPARSHTYSAPAAVSSGASTSKAPPTPATRPYKKGKIPKALREALWLKYCGKSFEVKCHTTWCQNLITAYDFHAGHNLPECRGGATTLDNLVPICSRCNLSMGSQYTFDEWCKLNGKAVDAPAALAPTAVPAKSTASISIWCCAGDCIDVVEPESESAPGPSPDPLILQRANPVTRPPTRRSGGGRRVSPSPPAGPAVIVSPSHI